MTQKEIVPHDSRYIVLTQQSFCCLPTCIQMVMIRHNIPLVQSEELAYHFGLSVTKEFKHLFWNPRLVDKLPKQYSEPTTRISKPEYEPNKVFKQMGIPLRFSQTLINQFKKFNDFEEYLKEAIKEGRDTLICFDWEIANPDYFDNYIGGYGHVALLDKLINDKEIRYIDPEHGYSKWPIIKIETLYEAMKSHGSDRGAGFWELEYIKE